MTLRPIAASLLAALVVVPTAVADPQPARPTAPPPDAFERAVPNGVEWHNPDAFMRYYRNHPNGVANEHPDGFAGVAAGVPRTGGATAAGEDGSLPTPLVAVTLVGLALAGLGLALLPRARRLRPIAR
jgi:hypothetical protein